MLRRVAVHGPATSACGEFTFWTDADSESGRAEEAPIFLKQGGGLLDVGVYPVALSLAVMAPRQPLAVTGACGCAEG